MNEDEKNQIIQHQNQGLEMNQEDLVKYGILREKYRTQLHLSALKKELIKYQDQLFKQLTYKVDPTDLEIAHTAVTRVEEQILYQIRNSHGHHSRENHSQSIDLSFDRLGLEISQPGLKLLQQEQNLKKQQEAQSFIARCRSQKKNNLKKITNFDSVKVKNEEYARSLGKIYLSKQKNHDKLSQKIKEAKQNCEYKIKEMIIVEEKYFKDLEDKLQKFNHAHSQLKEKSYEHIQIKRGIKSQLNKIEYFKVEIEKPLYQRLGNEFIQRTKREQKQKQQEYTIVMEKRKQYNNLDYSEHLKQYRILKQNFHKINKQRFEEQKNLGLYDKERLDNFDTNLWMLNKKQQQLIEEEHKQKQQERQIRLKCYFEYIKEFRGKFDQQKSLEILVLKDKLEHPKRYIQPLRRKKFGHFEKSDTQIYLESLQKEIRQINPQNDYFFLRNIGNNYLFELEYKNAMKRQRSKLKENQSVKLDQLLDNHPQLEDIQDETIQQNNIIAFTNFCELFLTNALKNINQNILEDIIKEEKNEQTNIKAFTEYSEQFFTNTLKQLITEFTEETLFLHCYLKEQSMNIILNAIILERESTNSISQLQVIFNNSREQSRSIKLNYHSGKNQVDWKKFIKDKRNIQ